MTSRPFDRVQRLRCGARTEAVSRTALVLGKTAGGATVAALQGTLMLVLAPALGLHPTALLVVEVVSLELPMAVALTSFGGFVASLIARMVSFQMVMQLVLFPMMFLSGALFPLSGLPTWLSVLTRLNPLTYAGGLLRHVVFAAESLPPAAAARFPTGVALCGHTLPITTELGFVAASLWSSSDSQSGRWVVPSSHQTPWRDE